MQSNNNSHTTTKYIILALIFGAGFLMRKALTPLWISIALACILDPLVSFWQERLCRVTCKSDTAALPLRAPAVLLAYATFLSAASLLIWSFADIVTGELSRGSLQKSIRILQGYYGRYQNLLSQISGFSLSDLSLKKILKIISAGSANALVGLIGSVYLLKDKSFFLSLVSKAGHLFLPQKIHGVIRELLYDINDVVSAFIKGVFIDSIIIALLDSLWLTVLGVNYGFIIGCFAGITNIIPYFGPVMGFIPAFISAFALGLSAFPQAAASVGGFPAAFIAVSGLLIIQQLEANLIYPRIVGKSVGLHPLFVLLAVSAAAYLGGLLWMILAVPAAGIAKTLIVAWAYRQ